MKHRRMRRVNGLMIALCLMCIGVLPVFADGEQINGGGTRWVDPVVFYKLQDITNNDLQHTYYRGDIDINKVIKKKGAKIYGMRLKPIAAAGMVPSYAKESTKGTNAQWTFSYSNHFGVEGIALHEAGFCIYADEGIDRAYDIDYTISCEGNADGAYIKDNMKANGEYKIKALTFVPKDGGISFSYSFDGLDKYYANTIIKRNGKIRSMSDNNTIKSSKPLGVNQTFGQFIYFNSSNRLFVIISGPPTTMTQGGRKGSIRSPYNSRPWGRVYFEVEEIQVDAAVAAEEMGEELLPDEEGAPELTQEDKEELKDFVSDLASWLKGEGDPLGLGEHTSAKESAVIGAIGTLVSILLGSGVGGFISGTGAQIAGNFTNTIIGGGGAELPPPVPDSPSAPPAEPKRPEEEEKPKEPEPEPEDDGKFHPTDYPEYCNRFISQLPDGDLRMKDPVTGKDINFFKNEEGKWENYKSGVTYTNQELEENLRYRVENSNPLRQDAATAERNQKEQREQWDAMNKRDLERGYTDEMKAYRDWKDEQAKIQKKEDYIQNLAYKYNTTVDNLKNEISKQQALAEEESYYQQEVAKQWDDAIALAEKVDKGTEIAINVMSNFVPGGSTVKNVYTFAKSSLVAVSESVAEGKSFIDSVEHINKGITQGALGVIQNAAGDLTKNPLKEYAIVVGTEMTNKGWDAYVKSNGDMTKTVNAVLGALGSKTSEHLTGKAFEAGLKTFKDTIKISKDSSKIIHIDKDTGFRFSEETSQKLSKFLNKRVDLSKFGGYNDVKIDNWKFDTSDVSVDLFKGKVVVGKVIEGMATETFSQITSHDWAGNVTVGIKDDAVGFVKDLNTLFNRAKRHKN